MNQYKMGDIGTEQEEIDVEPLEVPERTPAEEPVPA